MSNLQQRRALLSDPPHLPPSTCGPRRRRDEEPEPSEALSNYRIKLCQGGPFTCWAKYHTWQLENEALVGWRDKQPNAWKDDARRQNLQWGRRAKDRASRHRLLVLNTWNKRANTLAASYPGRPDGPFTPSARPSPMSYYRTLLIARGLLRRWWPNRPRMRS